MNSTRFVLWGIVIHAVVATIMWFICEKLSNLHLL